MFWRQAILVYKVKEQISCLKLFVIFVFLIYDLKNVRTLNNTSFSAQFWQYLPYLGTVIFKVTMNKAVRNWKLSFSLFSSTNKPFSSKVFLQTNMLFHILQYFPLDISYADTSSSVLFSVENGKRIACFKSKKDSCWLVGHPKDWIINTFFWGGIHNIF